MFLSFFFTSGATNFLIDRGEGSRECIGENSFLLLIYGFKLTIKLMKIGCVGSCKNKMHTLLEIAKNSSVCRNGATVFSVDK